MKIPKEGFKIDLREEEKEVHEAVQRKAFYIGCQWDDSGKEIVPGCFKYLYIDKNRILSCGNITLLFHTYEGVKISWQDFLLYSFDPTIKPNEPNPNQAMLDRDGPLEPVKKWTPEPLEIFPQAAFDQMFNKG